MNTIESVIEVMLTKFGQDSQIDVCIEEMSELTKALIKERRTRLYNREKTFAAASKEDIKEELADVLFMIEYLKKIFGFTDEELNHIVEKKAERTKSRYIDVEIKTFPENDEEPIFYHPANICIGCGKELPEGYGHVCKECEAK